MKLEFIWLIVWTVALVIVLPLLLLMCAVAT